MNLTKRDPRVRQISAFVILMNDKPVETYLGHRKRVSKPGERHVKATLTYLRPLGSQVFKPGDSV